MPIGIHHEVHGQGPALFLLPGLTQDVTLWGELIPALAERFQVIALDPRGAGRSTAGLAGLSTRVMAGDVLSLMDELGFEKASLLGFSLGGMVAQTLAAMKPERIDRMVLVSSAPRIGAAALAAIKVTYGLFVSGACISFANEAMVPWLFGEKALKDGTLVRVLAERTHLPTIEGFAAQISALENHDSSGLLPGIAARTLWIAGEEDVMVRSATAGECARIMPEARSAVLCGSGHMCYLEAPKEFLQVATDFLTA